jgi:pyruvate formate lyase activating enzyme
MAARIPVIPGYNDSVDNIYAAARFIAEELDKSIKVHLLPYHRLGEGKRKNLEQEESMFFSTPPENGHMMNLQKIFESYGLNAVIGG